MENTIEKIQTETIYEVTFDGVEYTVIYTEDANFQSGYISWEVIGDPEDYIEDSLKDKIIEFVMFSL